MQGIVVLNSWPTSINTNTTLTLRDMGEDRSEQNALIGSCAVPEGSTETRTSGIVYTRRSVNMDYSLHTSISLDEDSDITIEPVVITETQLDGYGILPVTPEPSMSRDSKSRGGSPPQPTPVTNSPRNAHQIAALPCFYLK